MYSTVHITRRYTGKTITSTKFKINELYLCGISDSRESPKHYETLNLQVKILKTTFYHFIFVNSCLLIENLKSVKNRGTTSWYVCGEHCSVSTSASWRWSPWTTSIECRRSLSSRAASWRLSSTTSSSRRCLGWQSRPSTPTWWPCVCSISLRSFSWKQCSLDGVGNLWYICTNCNVPLRS